MCGYLLCAMLSRGFGGQRLRPPSKKLPLQHNGFRAWIFPARFVCRRLKCLQQALGERLQFFFAVRCACEPLRTENPVGAEESRKGDATYVEAPLVKNIPYPIVKLQRNESRRICFKRGRATQGLARFFVVWSA